MNKILSKKIVFMLIIGFYIISNNLLFSNILLSSNSNVSILTCDPNRDAVYSFFGHSAFRVKDDSLKIDMVFDYGVFDFESPNFVMRFIKGDTDYIVINRSFSNFYNEYSYRGVGVQEQILNLTRQEKDNIFQFLLWNIQPENRVYRYNFLENNCSTKLRDILTNTLGSKIRFEDSSKLQTYRELINEYLVMDSWYKMGINLIIGSRADTIVCDRQKDFLPQYLYNSLMDASILTDSLTTERLVKTELKILEPSGDNKVFLKYIATGKQALNAPLYWGIILVLIAFIMTIYSKNRAIKWLPNLFDFLLYSVASVGGLIVFFLMFFSAHPCVGANWNLMWLNPLPLLVLPLLFIKSFTKYVIFYHFINFVLISVFLLFMYFIPQTFEASFIPFVFLLWMRSAYRIANFQKIKKIIRKE